MEFMKMREKCTSIRLISLLLLAFTLSLLSACGPTVIKGRPPFINISDMKLQGETLSASFAISNQNGEEMVIDEVDITVMINDSRLTRHNRKLDLTIDANSTEDVHVENMPDEFTRSLLASLGSGELQSLPFDISGRVLTRKHGYLEFEQTGYLYPVPGRPGQFRSAVTRAKGLKREELP
jgi:LEA14-like dessication related protein